jgi:hypothetical protein
MFEDRCLQTKPNVIPALPRIFGSGPFLIASDTVVDSNLFYGLKVTGNYSVVMKRT